jgi:protein TonB
VLARSDASEQPLDFTDSIVTGAADRYAGGVTSLQAKGLARGVGTATSAGRTPDANGARPELGPDRSHAPSVLGGLAWNCPFPPQADVDGVDQAQVTIRVEVDASGRLVQARVLSDPGHGFAEAARRCALDKRFNPGADRSGRPSASGINLSVRFVR